MLAHFISSVITSSRSKASALLVTLVYLNRVKSRLDPESFGATRVRERIVLGAIVLATKVWTHNAYSNLRQLDEPLQYTVDHPPENRRWARVARIFTVRDISSSELQLLHALDWDLSVTEYSVKEQMDRVSTNAKYCRIEE